MTLQHLVAHPGLAPHDAAWATIRMLTTDESSDLSKEDLEELRRRAEAMASRSGARARCAVCIDGPLEGHRFAPGEAAHGGASVIVGWCVTTRRGVVIAYYKRADALDDLHTRWRFEEWYSPTAKGVRIQQ